MCSTPTLHMFELHALVLVYIVYGSPLDLLATLRLYLPRGINMDKHKMTINE